MLPTTSKETPGHKEERLAKRRDKDRQRREAQAAKETPEQREERLARNLGRETSTESVQLKLDLKKHLSRDFLLQSIILVCL